MLATILTFFVGVAVGILVAYFLYKTRRTQYSGTLRIDRSDENPLMFLGLDEDVQTISMNPEVIFRVENRDILPHE
jgi:hypothetical protein